MLLRLSRASFYANPEGDSEELKKLDSSLGYSSPFVSSLRILRKTYLLKSRGNMSTAMPIDKQPTRAIICAVISVLT